MTNFDQPELCWKCKEERRKCGWIIIPGDHCHHEPKEIPELKCWCAYDFKDSCVNPEFCWKCKEERRKVSLNIWPGDHCHHEPKEKPRPQCWCAYDFKNSTVSCCDVKTGSPYLFFNILFCPSCGRKL